MPAGIFYTLLVNPTIETPSKLYFLSTIVYTLCAYLFLDSTFFTGKFLSKYKIYFALISLLGFTLIFKFPKEIDIFHFFLLGLLVLLYWPKNPLRKFIKPLRNIPFLKTSTVAFCFTFFTMLAIGENRFFYIFPRFLFYMALTFPFEVRDLKNDPEEMDSIVLLIGQKRTLILSFTLVLISSLLPLSLHLDHFELQSFSFFLAFIPLLLIYKFPDFRPLYISLDFLLLVQPLIFFKGNFFKILIYWL